MLKTIVIILLVFFTGACKTKNTSATESTTTTAANAVASTTTEKTWPQLLGSFVGMFGDNKIALLITKALGDSIQGSTIVGGNNRPFVGTVSLVNGIFNISAKEPGDHINDGIFNFKIKEAAPAQLEGTWSATAAPDKVKEYVLQKKNFAYDITVGDYPMASQKILKEEDVEQLSKWELELMRNEIFARHGYCFKKKELRKKFENESWYVPNTTNVANDLTAIEKKNIELIKRYHYHPKKYEKLQNILCNAFKQGLLL